MSREESLGLELADALRRQWWVALLVLVAFLGGVTAYARRLPTRWTSTGVVSFSPKPGTSVGGDTLRIVVPRFLAYATADATRTEIARRTGIEAGDLVGAIDASIAPDTANLTITTTLGTAEDAYEVERAVTDAVVAFAENDPLLAGTVVAPPVLPTEPSGPPRNLYVAAGALLAAALAAGAALLAERARPRVRRAADLGALVPYSVVGRIPRTRRGRANLSTIMSDPAVAASIRAMRTVVDSELRGSPLQVIAVTSPEPGAGKTTVAAALASSIAGLEVRVLLVDADLRRPRLGVAFGLPPKPTLGDALRGTSPWRSAVRPVPRQGLSVVPADKSDDSGDLVARGLGRLLTEMREEYEVVIVDCPPLLAGDDAPTIASLVDGVLLVVPVGSAETPVRDAALVLAKVSATVVGSVLTGDRSRRHMGSY